MEEDQDERLLMAANGSLDSLSNGASIQSQQEFSVTVNNVRATAKIGLDGTFEYWKSEESDRDSSNICSCCGFGDLSPFQAQGSDIVGVKRESSRALQILTCPGQSKNGRLIRSLQTSPLIHCGSEHMTNQVTHLLRTQNCWWGKDTAPRLFVFVNPVSGSGKTKIVWSRQAYPILDSAGIQMQMIETCRQNHAFEVVQKLDIQSIDAIICIGGDGTLSEVVQALLQRDDKEIARKIPLCLIPGGTGNGFSAGTNLWSPITAVHAICKGKTRNFDVLSVFQPPHPRKFSYLSITFGLIANVDIDTEWLRFLGFLRSQIAAVGEILSSNAYKARVSILKAPDEASRDKFWGSVSLDGQLDNLSSTTGPSFLRSFGDLQKYSQLDDKFLPEGWEIVQVDSFSLFVVSIMPHLAFDFTLAPNEKIDSGEMTLTYMPGNMPRFEALKAMLKIDEGKMSEVSKLTEEKIVAFILEPTADGTHIVLDGELLPYERIFCALHPRLCTAICAP